MQFPLVHPDTKSIAAPSVPLSGNIGLGSEHTVSHHRVRERLTLCMDLVLHMYVTSQSKG